MDSRPGLRGWWVLGRGGGGGGIERRREGGRIAVRAAAWFALALPGAADCSAPTAMPPGAPTEVGPAPLRRLGNGEYLNALSDLFPAVGVEVRAALPPLPDDTVVAGFENAAAAQAPSDVRIARYEAIARVYAAAATANDAAISAVSGCADWSTPELADGCLEAFFQGTARRVFRRPLSDGERDRFGQRFHAWQAAVDFPAALELTLATMLQAPQFLYRPEPLDLAAATAGATRGGADPAANPGVVPVEPYALASRLSFFLWESVPDEALLGAAASGDLARPERLRAEAERMLSDPRARRVYWSFHRQWLGLDRILGDEHVERAPEIDPAWSVATPAAASLESRLFVENVLAEGGTLADLLGSRRAFLDGEMARIYGVSGVSGAASPDGGAPPEMLLPEGERAGLLTRAAFLAGYAHRGGTSPPVRGNAVLSRLLCEQPPPPPPGVDLSQPSAKPGDGPKTNRMLFEERTAPAACQTCHASLNGVGYGFEGYDAAGAFRRTDHGLPVDASGTLPSDGDKRAFTGAIELSRALAESGDVKRCATQMWSRYALGRAPVDAEAATVGALAEHFIGSGGDVRALLLDIVALPTFRMRLVETAP